MLWKCCAPILLLNLWCQNKRFCFFYLARSVILENKATISTDKYCTCILLELTLIYQSTGTHISCTPKYQRNVRFRQLSEKIMAIYWLNTNISAIIQCNHLLLFLTFFQVIILSITQQKDGPVIPLMIVFLNPILRELIKNFVSGWLIFHSRINQTCYYQKRILILDIVVLIVSEHNSR